MQEIEKLRILQSQREAFRNRSKVVERERKTEEHTETVCPECKSRQLVHDYERAEAGLPELRSGHRRRLHRPRPRVAGLRPRPAHEAVACRRADDLHDPRQRPLDHDRLAEPGQLTAGRSPSKNRAQLIASASGTRIRVSNATERNLAFALSEAGPDGLGPGAAPERPRDGRGRLPRCGRQEPDPGALDRGRGRGRALRRLPAVQRAPDTRRDRRGLRVSRKEIGRTYRFISRGPGLKSLLPTSPIDYVPRFCSGLTLKGEVQSRAVEILRQAAERELTSGRGPTGVAAAAIYISSILGGERRTQREVAEVAGVTEVTIRNRYKELAEKLDIEIIL